MAVTVTFSELGGGGRSVTSVPIPEGDTEDAEMVSLASHPEDPSLLSKGSGSLTVRPSQANKDPGRAMEEKPAAGIGQGAGSECFSFLPALSVCPSTCS